MPDSEFGSDGQVHDMKTGELVARPESLAAREEAIPADTFEASEPASAAQRIRAFEDTHLPNTVRISGKVETGHGSRFKTLPIGHQRHYAALERLADAEDKLATANSALAEAQAAHASAKEQADNSEPVADEPEPVSTERSESEQGSG